MAVSSGQDLARSPRDVVPAIALHPHSPRGSANIEPRRAIEEDAAGETTSTAAAAEDPAGIQQRHDEDEVMQAARVLDAFGMLHADHKMRLVSDVRSQLERYMGGLRQLIEPRAGSLPGETSTS